MTDARVPVQRSGGDLLSLGSLLSESLCEFNRVFRMDHRAWPTLDVPDKVVELRVDLVKEEHREFQDELQAVLDGNGDLARLLKEAADLAIVLQGTCDAFGLDLDAGIAAVHASNMSKAGPDGNPVYREDGKLLKGPGYSPPDMAPALGLRPGA